MIKTPIIPYFHVLCSWLILSIATPIFSQNDLIFNELSAKNGLEDTKIVFVYKDSREFTWIGTLGSLYRFDGSEVVNYGATKGVDEPYLQSSMFEDKRGNLWFCTYNKLFCYDRLRDSCLSFGGFLEKNGVETLADYGLIHLDKQDQLWVTAGGKIFCLNISKTLSTQKLSFLPFATGIDKVEGKRFYPIHGQKEELIGFFEYFFYGSGMKVWTKTDSQSFKSIAFFNAQNPGTPQLNINQILPVFGKNNDYFLIAQNEILTYSVTNKHFAIFFKPASTLKFFSSVQTQPNILLCSTSDGLYYLNTQTKQLNKAKDWSTNLNSDDIYHPNVKQLFLDRNGILWGTIYEEGLCYTNPQAFKTGFMELGFQAENWLELSKGEWIFGTFNGLYLLNEGGNKRQLLNGRVNGIFKDSKKNIWILSDKSLYTLEQQSRMPKKILNDESSLLSFYQSSDDTYWISDYQNTKKIDLIQKNKTNVNAYTARLQGSRNIWEDTIYRRLYLHENGSNLHILQYRNGDWQKDTVFPIKGAFGGYLIPRGSNKVWVATIHGIVLIHRTKATLEELSFPVDWPRNNITGMVQDQQGTIWVSANTKILSFDAKGHPLRMYTPHEGFLAGPFQFESMQLLSDQSIGVLGRNGFNRFQPSQLLSVHALPQIQLTRLAVQGTPYHNVFPDDTSIVEKKSIRLRYRQNSISLRLVGIEMGQPQNVKIQYYLQGLEKKTEASIRNQVVELRYGKLAPGHYTLMVRAANANGEWTRWHAKLQIEIVPPFYMRWWFILLSILVGAAAVAIGVRWYFRVQLREARIRNEEQERILRDIHDLTSGKVVFFQDFQDFAEREIPQVDAKAKALNIAEQALQLFKRISAAVRNSTESDGTLLEFLHQLITESKKNIGTNLYFSAHLDSSIPYAWIAGEFKKHLRLVVQEALGNVLKHAQAKQVELHIEVVSGKLKLSIQDDGLGISDTKIAQIKPTTKIQDSGNGLGNMLSRVNSFGGDIKWTNQQGTCVVILISLQKIKPKRKFFFNFARNLLL